jgi:hypothetical protein
MNEEDDEELEIVFEPDEALILALNEIDNLKDLLSEQNSAIEQLKKEMLELQKDKISKKKS